MGSGFRWRPFFLKKKMMEASGRSFAEEWYQQNSINLSNLDDVGAKVREAAASSVKMKRFSEADWQWLSQVDDKELPYWGVSYLPVEALKRFLDEQRPISSQDLKKFRGGKLLVVSHRWSSTVEGEKFREDALKELAERAIKGDYIGIWVDHICMDQLHISSDDVIRSWFLYATCSVAWLKMGDKEISSMAEELYRSLQKYFLPQDVDRWIKGCFNDYRSKVTRNYLNFMDCAKLGYSFRPAEWLIIQNLANQLKEKCQALADNTNRLWISAECSLGCSHNLDLHISRWATTVCSVALNIDGILRQSKEFSPGEHTLDVKGEMSKEDVPLGTPPKWSLMNRFDLIKFFYGDHVNPFAVARLLCTKVEDRQRVAQSIQDATLGKSLAVTDWCGACAPFSPRCQSCKRVGFMWGVMMGQRGPGRMVPLILVGPSGGLQTQPTVWDRRPFTLKGKGKTSLERSVAQLCTLCGGKFDGVTLLAVDDVSCEKGLLDLMASHMKNPFHWEVEGETFGVVERIKFARKYGLMPTVSSWKEFASIWWGLVCQIPALDAGPDWPPRGERILVIANRVFGCMVRNKQEDGTYHWHVAAMWSTRFEFPLDRPGIQALKVDIAPEDTVD